MVMILMMVVVIVMMVVIMVVVMVMMVVMVVMMVVVMVHDHMMVAVVLCCDSNCDGASDVIIELRGHATPTYTVTSSIIAFADVLRTGLHAFSFSSAINIVASSNSLTDSLDLATVSCSSASLRLAKTAFSPSLGTRSC